MSPGGSTLGGERGDTPTGAAAAAAALLAVVVTGCGAGRRLAGVEVWPGRDCPCGSGQLALGAPSPGGVRPGIIIQGGRVGE